MIWPINNRSDSLQIDYHYIRRLIGKLLGYGYNHATWNDEQIQEVQEIIDEGLRQYYYPPVLPAPYAVSAMEAHEWTFMRPTWEFETAADQRVYALSADFEHPIGPISYRDVGDYYGGPIHFAPPAYVRELENRQDYTSPPEIAAVFPAESAGDDPQQLELVLHPTPDSRYYLALQYQSHGIRITEDHPFPLGGQLHGPGILASCLAVGEFRVLGQHGPKYDAFMQKLASNIARDRKRGSQIIGYNGNGITSISSRSEARRMDAVYYDNVTFGGARYDG